MSVSTINRLREWGITILRVGTGTSYMLHEIQEGRLSVNGLSGQVVVESLCAAALVLGVFTRWVSIPLAIGMVVDLLLIHTPNSFFHLGVNFEFALLRLFATVTLVLVGPGRAALGNILALKVPALASLQR